MKVTWKLTDRLVAGAVFVYALVLYLLTMAPTVSFWDAGEFIASVHGLEVMHPPGSPFYMLLGRLFSMFVPTEYVALSVNLISVLASALTVLLAHLILVRLIRTWQPPLAEQAPPQRITALVGGVIGACTFAATDSFWFNAVEAEVYALSMFFTAAAIWLIMRWSDAAQAEERQLRRGRHPFGLASNRYLILIAYLFGLAIGVHLLNLLTFFFVALIIFFTEYDRSEWSTGKRWLRIALTGVIASVAFLIIYPGIVQLLPELAGDSGFPLFFFLGVFLLTGFAVYYTHTRRMRLANLLALSLAMILIGYSSYALIFIRSATDPPIDLNDPETTEEFVSYVKREQYGSTPLLKGRSFDDETGRVTSEETLFPRRYSSRANHQQIYKRYDSDFEFFWKYQVGHMYLRYFLWNFSGRESDVQGAGAITGLEPRAGPMTTASTSATASAPTSGQIQTPSEAASRNMYFALPLLLGLFGMAYHLMRDWRRAFSVGVLFFITGLGIIIYLNQTPLQPRERDYSYVASFFAFSLWIGIGAAGLVELGWSALKTRLRGTAARSGSLLGIGGVLFLAVPFLMTTQNYDDHDRSGRYIAPDYAYNMLQSVAPNAVLFTNGDNDTYPLWYLQQVEGVRTDVRVVNLSLLRTPWYIKQITSERAGASAPVPFVEDVEIEELGSMSLQGMLWKPKQVSLPVDRSALLNNLEAPIASKIDTSKIESPMTWKLTGRPYGQEMNLLLSSDRAAYYILAASAEQGWNRPVYFATTVSRRGQLDLQNYFQLEGLAYRVLPLPGGSSLGRITPATAERLKKFRFRNLDDPDVYYNETARRMANGYRLWFSEVAQQLAGQGKTQEAQALLDTLSTKVPFETIAGDLQSYLLVARAYRAVGNPKKAALLLQSAERVALRPGDVQASLQLAREYNRVNRDTQAVQLARKVEPLVLRRLQQARSSGTLGQQQARRAQLLRYLYMEAGNFEAAAQFSRKLAQAFGDDRLRQSAEELRRSYEGATAPANERPVSEKPPSSPADSPSAPSTAPVSGH